MAMTRSPDRPARAVPEFRRLSYFYGQQLGPYDLQGEQAYLREKHRLGNRFLHGWGVVCGLEVESVKDADAKAGGKGAALSPRVVVRPGLALDCHGDEVVLRGPVVLDLWRELSPADRKKVDAGADKLWVSVCYCEQPVDPARPLHTDGCGVPAGCSHARVRETVALRVTVDRPGEPDRCEGCPGDCPDPCVVLARISGFARGAPLPQGTPENGVRRMLARHRLTTITGISFVHGATYSRDLASELLVDGFEVRFSDPVRVPSLHGAVEILVHTGGSGVAGTVTHKRGRFVKLPDSGLVDRFVYRQRGDERLEHGDRVIVRVLADFVLDECCRAVDGNHLGGRVPLLPGHDRFDAPRPEGCAVPPDRPGPWTSGNGTEGGVFETWFRVERREAGYERRND